MSGIDGVNAFGFSEEELQSVTPSEGSYTPISEDITGSIRERSCAIADRLTNIERNLLMAKERVAVIDELFCHELGTISQENDVQASLLHDDFTILGQATHHLRDQIVAIGTQAGVLKNRCVTANSEDFEKIPSRIFPDSAKEQLPIDGSSQATEGPVPKGTSCCHLIDLIRAKIKSFSTFFYKLWKNIYNVLKKLLSLMKLGVFSREFWDSIRVRYALFQDPKLLGCLTRFGFSLSNFDRHSSETFLLPDLSFDEFSKSNFLSQVLDDVGGLTQRIQKSSLPKRTRDRLQDEIKEAVVIFDQILSPALWGVQEHISCIASNLTGILEFSENIMTSSDEETSNRRFDDKNT